MFVKGGAAVRDLGLFLYRATGTGVAIAVMELLAGYVEVPVWRVPFVTSIVLVTALPYSEASRPYSVIAGHMCSCAAGLAVLFLLGPGDLSSAVGVGLASFGMLAIRAPHPPAGIDAFLIVANALPPSWALNPVLAGCLMLVLFSGAWSIGERVLFREDKSEIS
jgi:CBS-domain-containing membrane protein